MMMSFKDKPLKFCQDASVECKQIYKTE